VGGLSGIAVVDVDGWRAHRSVALAWRRGTSMEAAFRVIAEHVQRSARRMLERDLG
jgi:LysR family hydrogen peroxide-inducible transcriptional activator